MGQSENRAGKTFFSCLSQSSNVARCEQVPKFLFLFKEKVATSGGTRFFTTFGTGLPLGDGKG